MSTKEQAKETARAGEFDPHASMYEVFDRHVERLEVFYDEIGRRHGQAVEQTTRTIGELSKMTQDTISFSNLMAREWFEAARGTTRWASSVLGAWAR